jgi:hypothetical protein
LRRGDTDDARNRTGERVLQHCRPRAEVSRVERVSLRFCVGVLHVGGIIERSLRWRCLA